MMTNLFSTFDPCTGFWSMNWLSISLPMVIMKYKFWTTKNNTMTFYKKVINKMQEEMYTLYPKKGSTMMFISMFMMIMINNFMGLLPYVFTASSHLVFSLSLAMPMWITLMMYGWTSKTNSMFMSLVPTGTPTILMPFMILIETISNLIRPGSLGVRLSANMIAGHLLMSLLGSSMKMELMIMLTIIFMMLLAFETAVSMIQAYVFMTLSTLYSTEV